MKKILSIIIVLFFFSGCAAPQQKARWYKAGVSQYDTNSYLASCRYKVGMNKVDAAKERSLITSCMVAAGFRWGKPRQR